MGGRWAARRITQKPYTMKTILFLIVFSLCFSSTIAQEKYLTKTGTVGFEASVPTFEPVAAKNKTVTAIFDTSNGEIAALALVKGFRFEVALMEEHFNENYAESDNYPKITFKGTIKNFNIGELNNQSEYTIDGDITFHGQTKSYQDIPVTISQNRNQLTIKGRFTSYASDFDIKIPKVVRSKIAEEVNVYFEFVMTPK